MFLFFLAGIPNCSQAEHHCPVGTLLFSSGRENRRVAPKMFCGCCLYASLMHTMSWGMDAPRPPPHTRRHKRTGKKTNVDWSGGRMFLPPLEIFFWTLLDQVLKQLRVSGSICVKIDPICVLSNGNFSIHSLLLSPEVIFRDIDTTTLLANSAFQWAFLWRLWGHFGSIRHYPIKYFVCVLLLNVFLASDVPCVSTTLAPQS